MYDMTKIKALGNIKFLRRYETFASLQRRNAYYDEKTEVSYRPRNFVFQHINNIFVLLLQTV